VKPVSLVSDIVHTDDAGKAVAHLVTPEFLGQLRIMAVAHAGPLMGSEAKPVLVRSPLVVQTSFPRFLAPGDSAKASFLMINNSPAGGTASLKLTTNNGDVLAFDAGAHNVALAAGGQKIVTATITAKGVGISQIAVEAKLNDDTFTENLEMPVRPASPAISRGAYATASQDKPFALEIPGGLLAGTGSFELRIGQRPALGLPEGLEYLDKYPHGCLEQTTSQCFPLVYLNDIGKQIAPGVFEKDSVDRKVKYGITRMIGMQTSSGGLAMWTGGHEPWPWGSVYAAHFVIEAEKAGHAVPEDFKTRLMAYVRSCLTTVKDPVAEIELQAYAAYVVALAGKPDRAALSRIGDVIDAQAKQPGSQQHLPSARLHLALAWAAAGRNDLAEKLFPEKLPAPRQTRELDGNLGSPIRDQALLLTTLLTISPEHPEIVPLVDRLSASAGWLSTQDNAFAVMAIGKYLRVTAGEKPFEVAELMDGDKVLGTASGKDSFVWTAPANAPQKLSVRVKGDATAKAYVSWLQSGVPLEMPKDADHSLKLRRVYLTEDDKPVDLAALTTGTAVKVQITVESGVTLQNVVIEDLLPAGLEIENARLQNTQQLVATDRPKVTQLASKRMDVRDDRIVIVTNLQAGTSSISYLARAITPGTYVVPPLRGECMYDPSINSINGGGARMTVISHEKKVLANR
jgi:uncharacterized protein YfaS (alpha-2-macroglobulin family)